MRGFSTEGLIMEDLRNLQDEIARIIERESGETGHDFTNGAFEGLGWLNFHYRCSTYDGPYPRIALKLQKNAVHLYLMVWVDGEPPLKRYAELFGKSAVGRCCLRIKFLDDERRKAIAEIVRIAIGENQKKQDESTVRGEESGERRSLPRSIPASPPIQPACDSLG